MLNANWLGEAPFSVGVSPCWPADRVPSPDAAPAEADASKTRRVSLAARVASAAAIACRVP